MRYINAYNMRQQEKGLFGDLNDGLVLLKAKICLKWFQRKIQLLC